MSIDYTRIGKPGKLVNDTQAMSSANLTGNYRVMLAHDEFFKMMLRLNSLAIGKIFLAILVTVLCLRSDHGGLLFLGFISFIISIFMVIKYLTTYTFHNLYYSANVYKFGCLLPAIIVKLDPLVIGVSAELQKSSDESALFGLQYFIIESAPLANFKVGEILPCVAFFEDDYGKFGHWLGVNPRPLSWGTDDPKAIQCAIDAIPQEEWRYLRSMVALRPEELVGNRVALFDQQLVYQKTIVKGTGELVQTDA